MNDTQKLLHVAMDEYADPFDELPPLYCVTVWTRDRENVYADLKLLARKAAKDSLNIEPLCIGDYFFKHRSETDANLPEFLVLDPFTHSFYNVAVFFFVESDNQEDHQIMRSKSSGRLRPNAASIKERRSSLKKPFYKFAQLASLIYPHLVKLDPFPFFPLVGESQPRRLAPWKLTLLLMRLSLESPEQFGLSDNYIGLGGGLPLNLHTQTTEKIRNELRPKYAQGFSNIIVTVDDMVSRLRPTGVVKPREGWPLEAISGQLVWQQPTLISVLRQDVLMQVAEIIRKVASSPSGTVSLSQDNEESENLFLKEGKHFRIRFLGGEPFKLENSVGLDYIWIRLKNQGQSFSAEMLMAYGKYLDQSDGLHDAIPEGIAHLVAGDNEVALDRNQMYEKLTMDQRKQGSSDYKILQLELKSARPARAAKIKADMESLRKYYKLTKDGELGRQRTQANSSQRRTESVSKAIKAAVTKIRKNDSNLATYLSSFARYSKGTFDVQPERIEWVTD